MLASVEKALPSIIACVSLLVEDSHQGKVMFNVHCYLIDVLLAPFSFILFSLFPRVDSHPIDFTFGLFMCAVFPLYIKGGAL